MEYLIQSGASVSLSSISSLNIAFTKLNKLCLLNCYNLTETGVISLFSKIGVELEKLHIGVVNINTSYIDSSRFSCLKL